jgi:EmrB/QacA subfamily drug resistance transporter
VSFDLPPPPPPPVDVAWLVEPARPERVRRSPHGPWLVVATVCLGAFMGQLDASIVALALPPIQRHFLTSLGAVEWVSLAYLLVLVVLVVPAGRLSDMLGRKLLYVYGFAVFTVGSVACGLAPGFAWLVVFRVVQAMGAALLQANSVALIATAVPRSKLGRAIGVQGAAQAIGLAVGPAVGGVLVAAAGWRWVFLVNAPIGVAGVASGILLLPRTRTFSPRVPFDRTGLALLATSVATTLYALSRLGQHNSNPVVVVVLVVVAAAAATGFVLRERSATHPLLPPSLFANRSFSSGLVAGLLSYLVMFGVLFATPFLLAGRGEHAGTAGLVVTALPAALAVGAPIGGRLADRYGAVVPTVAGMALAAAALAAIAAFVPSTPVLAVLLAGAGFGLGVFTPANNAAIMASAAVERAGVAGGVLNMTRGVGTSLGVAVTGVFLAGRVGAAGSGGYRDAVALLAAAAVASAVAAGAGRRTG